MIRIRRHLCVYFIYLKALSDQLHEPCSVLNFSYTVCNGYVISYFPKQLVSGVLDVTQVFYKSLY
jgi:hypothetical protein